MTSAKGGGGLEECRRPQNFGDFPQKFDVNLDKNC